MVDHTSGLILSTSYLDIGWRPTYTTTVLSNATAPNTNGPWRLALNLYIFEEASMVTSSKNHFVDLTVGTNSVGQPVAATSAQSNATIAANTQIPSQTQTIPYLASGVNSTPIWPYAIAAMITVIVLAAGILLVEDRRKT